MLKREDIATAKKIVNFLLRGDRGKVAVCYLRVSVKNKKVPSNDIVKEKQTNYSWERVKVSKREKCWSWQVVLVDRNKVHLLPNHIPVWKDDATNGNRSLINFSRAGVDVDVIQADLPLVSRLIGEPINRKRLSNHIRCWYVKNGVFLPSNREFSRTVIGLRCKIMKLGTCYTELFTQSKEQLLAKGFNEKEVEIIERFHGFSVLNQA